MNDECFYCGDDHEDDRHEVLTSLDWGRSMILHDGSAVDNALSEASALGVDVADLARERDDMPRDDEYRDIDVECSSLDDIESRLYDAGYFVGSDPDGGTWYIAGPASA